MDKPPLVSAHADETLVESKLRDLRKVASEILIDSLKPGGKNALRARPEGTLLNGHHRIKVLRERGVDVNALPREILEKEMIPDLP